MIQAFLPPSYRVFTKVPVAALCLGLSLTAVGQASLTPGALSGPGGGMVPPAAGNAAPARPVAESTNAESAQKPASGVNQGLKMHGHWTINIKNPDGTLVQHHEFENSLQYDGDNYLVGLLSGYAAAGPMEIYFTSANGIGSPCIGVQYNFCAIVYSTTTEPGLNACSIYYCAGGLTMTPTFGQGPTLTLAGSITANATGTVGMVSTGMNGCGQPVSTGFPTGISPVSPSTCFTANSYGAGSGSDFSGTMTSTQITPISVTSGQIIQVTVVLSFS